MIVEWEFVLREYGPDTNKKLLETDKFKSLDAYSRYKVSLYNSYGLGEAMEADETVPFYKTWWFLVIIALVALVIIIIIVSVLCCYCYRTKGLCISQSVTQCYSTIRSFILML